MDKKRKRHHKQKKKDTAYNIGDHEKGIGIRHKGTEEGLIPAANDKKAIDINPPEIVNATYERDNKVVEEDTIKIGQTKKAEACEKENLIEKTEQDSKLDLTTKILIAIFAILLLIIIFAKKLGIQGFP